MFPELAEWVNAATDCMSALVQGDEDLAETRMIRLSAARDKLIRLAGGPVPDPLPGIPRRREQGGPVA